MSDPTDTWDIPKVKPKVELTDLPEAPASVTYSLIDPDGYPILYTVRGMSGIDLLRKMDDIRQVLKVKGYTPQEQRYSGNLQRKLPTIHTESGEGEYAPTPCPICGARVKIAFNRKTGKRFAKCEKNLFINGRQAGCTFIDWRYK